MFPTIPQLIKTSRYRFWLYLAGPVLLAIGSTPHLLGWLFFAYILTCGNIILYGVNDLADVDTDALNTKKQSHESWVNSETYRQQLTRAIWVCIGLGLLFIPFISMQATILFALWLFLSIAYSARPLRFKARPYLDSLSNILYIVPGVTAYVIVTGTLPHPFVIYAGGLWSIAMHLYSAIPDQVPDTRAGITTTATKLGTVTSLKVCGVLWALSFICAYRFSPWGLLMLIYPLIISIILHKPTHEQIERVYWRFPYINAFIGFMFYLIIVFS